MNHFMNCDDEEVLDLLEAIFQVYPTVHVREFVGPINDIFQEEGIGFELTPFRETMGEPIVNKYGGLGGRPITYDFPKAVRKDTEYLHNEVVRPCLEALGRPGFGHRPKQALRRLATVRWCLKQIERRAS